MSHQIYKRASNQITTIVVPMTIPILTSPIKLPLPATVGAGDDVDATEDVEVEVVEVFAVVAAFEVSAVEEAFEVIDEVDSTEASNKVDVVVTSPWDDVTIMLTPAQ